MSKFKWLAIIYLILILITNEVVYVPLSTIFVLIGLETLSEEFNNKK